MWSSSPGKDTHLTAAERDEEDSRTVYIGNLTSDIPSELLLDIFTARFGDALLLHRANNQNEDRLGFAFLKCATMTQCQEAITACSHDSPNPLQVCGRTLVVTRRKKYSERRGLQQHPAQQMPYTRIKPQSSSPRSPQQRSLPTMTASVTTPWRDVASIPRTSLASLATRHSPLRQQHDLHDRREETRQAHTGDVPFSTTQIAPVRTIFHSDLILVQNLPPSLDPRGLFDAFVSCRPEAVYIYPQPDIHGQRYGEVQFLDSKCAQRAMELFDEVALDGYIVKLGFRPYMLESDWHEMHSSNFSATPSPGPYQGSQGSCGYNSQPGSSGSLMNTALPMQRQPSMHHLDQRYTGPSPMHSGVATPVFGGMSAQDHRRHDLLRALDRRAA